MEAEWFDFEKVLQEIGQFGKWQKRIFFWLWIVSAANGIATITYAFTGFVPKHRCSIPYCEDSASIDLSYATNGTFPDFVLAASPSKTDLDSGHLCDVLSLNGSFMEVVSCSQFLDEISQGDALQITCSHEELIFDQSVVQSSIVTQFGLTCHKKFFKNIIGSIYMVGLMLGSFSFGLVADKFGRKKALMLGIFLTSASGTLGAFMPTAIWFAVMRFITGFGAKGLFMIAFVLCVEFTGPKYSAYLGIAINIPFALGQVILGLEAYFLRDWVTLQLVAYAPIIGVSLLWLVLPESPRWLLANHANEKAKEIVLQGAKANGKTIPNMSQFTRETSSTRVHLGNEKIGERQLNILDTFRPLPIFWRTLNLFFQWFSVTFCYYGLSYGSTNLLGNVHTNFLLVAFIEIPGYIFAMSTMDCWGRMPILAFCQTVAGLSCIIAGFLSEYEHLSIAQVCFALLGKMLASASFAVVYQFTAELYPTQIRTTAVGNCSTMARFGSVFSLLVDALAVYWTPSPMVLMGGISVVAGFAALLLPETAGLPLPQTLQDALDISMNKQKCLGCLKDVVADDHVNH